jgi:hypothetical protein
MEDKENKATSNLTLRFTDTTIEVCATVTCQLPLYLTLEERAKLPPLPQYQHLEDQAIESLRQIALGHAAYQSGDLA